MSQLDTLFTLPPQGVELQPIQLPSEVKTPVHLSEDETILKIVAQDVASSEAFIQNRGKLEEWLKCERLYTFRVPIQNWPGSNMPRAHLGMPVVLEHVESLIPQIMLGLFGDNPPFKFIPTPNTKLDAARANDQLIGWELRNMGFRAEVRKALKRLFIYGTVIGRWGWRTTTQKVVEMKRKTPQKFEPIGDGETGGQYVDQPGSDELEAIERDVEVNEPYFETLDLRHVRFDTGLAEPDIRKAKWVAYVQYTTLNGLNELRSNPLYDIPPEAKLLQLFFPPKETPKKDALDSNAMNLENDFQSEARDKATTVDPYSQPLQLVEYVTKDNVYVVVQGRLIIRKSGNQFGRINYVSAGLIDVPNSAYALGLTHIIGGEQRMQQGVINAFLDDLSLSLNGMFVRVRGANVPYSQISMRPGGVLDAEDKDGISLLARQPVQMEALAVLQGSDSRAQRRSGANEMLVLGSTPSEKSSVTRTATGVEKLTAGVGARLQDTVENFADSFMVPVIEAIHLMNRSGLRPSQLSAILSTELKVAYNGDVVDLLNVRGRFEILAGAKLQMKRAISQLLPLLSQWLTTEPVLEAIQAQGKKIDWLKLTDLMWDMNGIPGKNEIIADMSQDDEMRGLMQNPGIQGMMTNTANNNQQAQIDADQTHESDINRSGRDVVKMLLNHVQAHNAPQKAASSGK